MGGEEEPVSTGTAATTAAVASAEVNRRRLRRCVTLLRTFLQWRPDAGSGGGIGGGGSAIDSAAAAAVAVQVLCGPQCAPTLEVLLPASATVADLRAEVARFFDEVSRVLVCTSLQFIFSCTARICCCAGISARLRWRCRCQPALLWQSYERRWRFYLTR